MAFRVTWNEDGSASVLGRLTARDGGGAATGVDGEGKWLQQADVQTITCNIFDLSSLTPDTPLSSPAVVVATSILDTPVTDNEIWTRDTIGYNFLHDLISTSFPSGGNRYSVEYTVTLTGGTVFHAVYTGVATPIRSS